MISGGNLNGTGELQFNNVNAPAFAVNSSTQITATVPADATTGRVTLKTPAGTATSPFVFTVTAEPSIGSFTPAFGGTGTIVQINGANLSGTSEVRVGGTAAAFTVNSAVNLTATVPAGATTGPLSLTTPSGSATSATSFMVVAVPTINGFSPSSGPVGVSVSINGSNFTGATAVRFNGINSAFSIDSASQITTTVPTGASSGILSITTPGGTATSSQTFAITLPPTNDNFSNAQVIAGVSGSVTGDNTAATKESGEPDHAGNTGGKSVWYTWTATNSGAFQLTTVGSEFDTTMAVYIGATLTSLTPIASGDDTPDGKNSTLTIVATSGTTYGIAVDGFRSPGGTTASASAGSVTLNWSTTTAPAITGFTPNSGAPNSTATINGVNFSGATAVRFNGVTASTFVVDSPTQITATVPSSATTGNVQIVTPGGTAVSSSVFTVVNPPANDDFVNAQPIAGTSGLITGRNNDASMETGESNHGGVPGGRSIWFSWTAPSDGRWTFDTRGSNFDTTLAVYTGSSVNGLSLVAENNDSPPGTISRVAITASSGTLYRIAVDGYNGATGNATLNWAFTPNLPTITSFNPAAGSIGSTVVLTGTNFTGTTGVRVNGVLVTGFTVNSATQITFSVPFGANSGSISISTPNGTAASDMSFMVTTGQSNDQFANAQLLSGSAAITAGKNIAATKEAGEPNHAADPGGRSLWYSWMAPSSGTWAFDTAGSSFDTTLAVYSGASLNSLTEVGSDDDTRADLTSKVVFDATAGTVYQVAVDGFGGDNGNLVLKLIPSAAPQVIYETGFESVEGFNFNSQLSGQGGWTHLGSGGNGFLFEQFPGLGQQVGIGFDPPFFGDDSLIVWHPLNFIPDTNNRPVVRFSVLMGIIDSFNFVYDTFHWSVYNTDGNHLFSVGFDNFDLNVYYRLNDGNGFMPTGATFQPGTIYDLVFTMDFSRNRWSATFLGETVVSELAINTTNIPLNLGDIDAEWHVFDPFFPGNNLMIFDEYRVIAEPSEQPSIELAPQSQSVAVGATVEFSVAASGGEPLQYQWQFNGTPLPGQNSPTIRLINVGLGQSGDYSVNVSNDIGTATNAATLTVSVPEPIGLTGAARLADGRFQMTVTGTAGSQVAVEFSADLIHWENLTTVQMTGGSLTLSDPDAGTQPRRFYRARQQ